MCIRDSPKPLKFSRNNFKWEETFSKQDMEDNSHSEVTASLEGNIPSKRLLSFNIRKILSEVESPSGPISLAERLNSRLYEKYCSSQNFYYTKEIDNILCGIKSSGSIQYNEEVGFMTEWERKEEMLKRYYQGKEYPKKIKLLSEYYKFHEDVPRLAMLPLSSLIHNYHDQKRRINYIKITKMLNNGKIDSEIIRNMDPNEDSDFSKCTVASSLLSFLPEEFKYGDFSKQTKKGSILGRLQKKNRAIFNEKGSPKEGRSNRKNSKKKKSKRKGSQRKGDKLSPISGYKGQFYLEKPSKIGKNKSKTSICC